jgi:trehalose 6-phosphate phosphatase
MTEQTTHVDETAAPGLDAALDALARAGRVIVALDFDGTLAPFADEPSQVGALPGSWAAVLTLHRAKDTEVVLVSGRPLGSLAAVSHAPQDMALVGSHGVEWRVDGHDEAALTDDEVARVARIGAALDEVGARYPGVVIEHKRGRRAGERGCEPSGARGRPRRARTRRQGHRRVRRPARHQGRRHRAVARAPRCRRGVLRR